MEALLARICDSLGVHLPRCSNSGCGRAGELWSSLRGEAVGLRCEGNWYCGADCLESALQKLLSGATGTPEPARSHRIPLGLWLFERGEISASQLKLAIERHRARQGSRLGECLREIGAAKEPQIARAVAGQWGCPVFRIDGLASAATELVPYPLLEQHRMLPVHVAQERHELHMAFSQRIDYSALYAVQHVLQYTVQPCIAEEPALARGLETAHQSRPDSEILFDGVHGSRDIARIARSYAVQVEADDARVALLQDHAWIALRRAQRTWNLVFGRSR